MRPLGIAFAALVIACSSPHERPTGDGDLPYPRIAGYRLGSSFDDSARDMLRRVPLAVLDVEMGATDPDRLTAAVAAGHPRLQLLARLPAEDIGRAPDSSMQPLATSRLRAIPARAWVLGPGSTTVGVTGPADTRIRVADPAAFSVMLPPSPRYGTDEPTYLLIGGEHVRLLAIEGDELVVEREAAAGTHALGTAIAPHVVLRAGTWLVDVTQAEWRDMLVAEAVKLVEIGPWHGIALDSCGLDIASVNGLVLDLDRDGAADDLAVDTAAWSAGIGELVTGLRGGLGDDAPLVATTDGGDCPHDALDGLVLEGFPTGPPTANAVASDVLDRYVHWTARADHPPLSVAAAYSPLIGSGALVPGQDDTARADYAAMRFGLAFASMGDGYYTFDNGPFGHTTSWWYDEYDGAGRGVDWLGHPQGPATRIAGGGYVRTFTNGLVIANPTSTPITFSAPPGYRKLDGDQDPAHNDGSEVTSPLVVNGMDAYVLAR